ncbi:hypothetical protein M422DRAFT_26637 [Sphaerobolus stellatus SS14]|nr:hypothetical protein M422DRAFT_26637 [Sphaerobolus stellatus SS14]
MDALKSDIAQKRKALQDDPLLATRPTKYMRRGEIEKLRLEQEQKEKEEKLAKSAIEKEAKEKARRSVSAPRSSQSPAPASQPTTTKPEGGAFNISNEETVRRLRQKSQPIRLFGESDKERRLRLRALELLEEKGGDKGGGTNDFKKALEDVEQNELAERALGTKDPSKGKEKKDEYRTSIIDLSLTKTDPDKLYPLIYNALKRTLKDWEAYMAERPENIKRSTQGRLAAATQMQTAEYLKPLFKTLRSRALPADVLGRIAEIVYYMQMRQYQRANDSYLRLSIGNAPWPIGVTMVGIHERSAREKISSDQVAHVLNDEVSRKYIQSLKRLLTFSQSKYPPDDSSQLMG